jgi:hypothetical protein
VTEVVELLTTKYEALSSNPSTAKKKNDLLGKIKVPGQLRPKKKKKKFKKPHFNG